MELSQFIGRALGKVFTSPPPPPTNLPPGKMVDLPGRGRTFVFDVPGPPGAPTLILLHALGCTAYLSWFPSVAELSKHYRVVSFDQRWHGHGIRCEHFSLADCADDVAAVADALGIDRFTVVGYSMGGAIAQLVWRRHKARVEGLVLCATARNFRGTAKEKLWYLLLRGAMTRWGARVHERVDRYAERLVGDPVALSAEEMQVSRWAMQEFRSTSAWCFLGVVDEIGRFDSSAWIGRVNVPTSVVVADHDMFIPTRRQRRLAAAIPGAMVYDVPGSHAVMVLGADRFVPVLVEACRSVTRRITDRQRASA